MIKVLLLAVFSAGLSLAEPAAEKSNSLSADAEKAWKEIETASKPPTPPKEWGNQPPTAEQKEQFQKLLGEKAALVAAKAKEFYNRFPDHPKAPEAKAREERFLQQAIQYGNPLALEQSRADLTEDQKVELKLNQVHHRAMEKRAEGIPAVLKEFESGLREVMKEYPKNPLPWQQMMILANSGDADTQKRVLAEIVDSRIADDETIARAKGKLKAIGALGRPLEISFTAADGRKVDIQKMQGKVVLVDFWASWCGPCMRGLPEVVDLYKRYRDKGFEIVGISLDKQQEALQGVVERYEIPWAQYFDGKGWGNKFTIEYSIAEIPTMWLVDKKGILRTMRAREELEKQVEELLAEKI